MSINFSQNPHYVQNPNNFNGNAPISEPPLLEAMANSMDLPTKPKDIPFLAGGIGFSLLVSKLAGLMSRFRGKDVADMTVADSFNKSAIGRFTEGFEKKVIAPVETKYAKQIGATKGFLAKITPKWAKDAYQKMVIGVMPKWNMPKTQFNGMTGQSINYFFDDVLKKVPTEKLKELGLSNLLKNVPADYQSRLKLFNEIAGKLDNLKLSNFKPIEIPRKGWLAEKLHLPAKKFDFISEFNKTKTFVAPNAKKGLSRGLQRFLVGSTEAAGGAVIGGGFGVFMNAIFVASALKRTWNAPKEDKFSTFTEAVFADFIGQYYMMLLATKLAYKILGLKNIDKTPHQIARTTQLFNAIQNKKNAVNNIEEMIRVKNGKLGILTKLKNKIFGVTDEAYFKQLAQNLKLDPEKCTVESLEALKKTSVSKVNKAIDRLAAAKKLKNNGAVKNFFNRPIKWIGDFMSAGLETVPAKLKEVGKVSGFKAGWQKFKNVFKGGGGAGLRFWFIMFVLAPILTKPVVKLTHAIFGKPKKSFYEEYYQKDSKKNEKTNVSENVQKVSMDDFSQFTKMTGAIKAQQNPNLYSQNYNSQISSTLIDEVINAQKNKVNSSKSSIGDSATYVPSITPTAFTDTELANAVNSKLAYSDRIENYVKKELSSLDANNPYNI